MNLCEQLDLNHEQYGLLFDVRRSVRYHDRRRGFYEQCHHITSLLTILMAGSVLFDIGKTGEAAHWLYALSVLAALMAAADMVIGYSKRAVLHGALRERFADLEIAMVCESAAVEVWQKYQRERLLIEKDEPPVYRVLDLLCRNELLQAEGYTREKSPGEFFEASLWQKLTSQLWRWDNAKVS